MEEDELQALAHRFYMDTYSVDQNACSSPSSVIWHDEGGQWAEKEGVRKRWWAAVEQAAAAYQLTPSRAYRKFQALCEAALNDTSLCEAVRYGNRLWGGAGTKRQRSWQNGRAALEPFMNTG